jgi:hypothetical protein
VIAAICLRAVLSGILPLGTATFSTSDVIPPLEAPDALDPGEAANVWIRQTTRMSLL